MLSNTKMKVRIRRKTNPSLVETINAAMEKESWKPLAKNLSGPTRKFVSLNLFEIDSQTSEGDTVIVVGKVLSKGELTKKLRICALSFSKSAFEKMKDSKSEALSILDEIKKNPKAEGVKILK